MIATNVHLVGVQPTRNVIGKIMSAMAIHHHTQIFPLPLGAGEKQVIPTVRFAGNGNGPLLPDREQYICGVIKSFDEFRKGCHPEHAIVSGLRLLYVRTTSAEIEGDPSKAEQPCCAEVVRRWVDAMLWPSTKFQK